MVALLQTTFSYKFSWLKIIAFCFKFHSSLFLGDQLTLNMQGASYLSLTWSISQLLMPWFLSSPENQQPWYWLSRIRRSLSYLKRISTICVISMWRNDIKCKYMFMFPLKNLAHKGLTICHHWYRVWLGVKQVTSHYLGGISKTLMNS